MWARATPRLTSLSAQRPSAVTLHSFRNHKTIRNSKLGVTHNTSHKIWDMISAVNDIVSSVESPQPSCIHIVRAPTARARRGAPRKPYTTLLHITHASSLALQNRARGQRHATANGEQNRAQSASQAASAPVMAVSYSPPSHHRLTIVSPSSHLISPSSHLISPSSHHRLTIVSPSSSHHRLT